MLDNRKLVLYQRSGPVDDPFDSANLTQCEMGDLVATPMLLLTVIAKYWGIRHRCKLNWIVNSQAATSKVSINIQPGEFISLPFRQW
jgi:hypothetical protein